MLKVCVILCILTGWTYSHCHVLTHSKVWKWCSGKETPNRKECMREENIKWSPIEEYFRRELNVEEALRYNPRFSLSLSFLLSQPVSACLSRCLSPFKFSSLKCCQVSHLLTRPPHFPPPFPPRSLSFSVDETSKFLLVRSFGVIGGRVWPLPVPSSNETPLNATWYYANSITLLFRSGSLSYPNIPLLTFITEFTKLK
jgi:hypothetical protein